jgi:hypothetical protein
MRIETRKLYSAAELKKYKNLKGFAGAFDKAYEAYLETQGETGLEFESDDLFGSLKGLFNACSGIKLKDWSLGLNNRDNHIRVEFTGGRGYGEDEDAIGEFTGARAMAWIENNLLSGIRVPFIPLLTVKLEMEKRDEYYRKLNACGGDREARAAVPKNFNPRAIKRHYYKPGTIGDCPFTGMCYDDDFLDALRKNIKDGDTLKTAFESLDGVFVKLLESANDYQRTEEYFLGQAEANDYEYDKDGDRI